MNLPIYPKSQFTGELQACGSEKLTVTSGAVVTPTAAKLTATGKHPVCRAWLTIETGNIRYTVDGTDPTVDNGHLAYADGSAEVLGHTNVAKLKMIAISDTATVQVTYSRYEE